MEPMGVDNLEDARTLRTGKSEASEQFWGAGSRKVGNVHAHATRAASMGRDGRDCRKSIATER